MSGIAEQYRKEAAAIALHKNQDELVGEYLKEYHEVDSDFLYNVGLPGCGRIKNPAQRIAELRAQGWEIKTDTDRVPGKCFYVLINTPDGIVPEKETSPSFEGFGRFLAKRELSPHSLSPEYRDRLYREYLYTLGIRA